MSLPDPAPNQALEPTASSFGFAYASGGGSPPALGGPTHPAPSPVAVGQYGLGASVSRSNAINPSHQP
jgi:hypothetical protein